MDFLLGARSGQHLIAVGIRVMRWMILGRAWRCERDARGLHSNHRASSASRSIEREDNEDLNVREVPTNHQARRSRMIPRQLISGVLGLSLLGLAAAGCGTATGAAVGAGSGAAIGAGTGYGAGKGALIGLGVGAAAGAVYDITKHNK